jgi:hypothetical protein
MAAMPWSIRLVTTINNDGPDHKRFGCNLAIPALTTKWVWTALRLERGSRLDDVVVHIYAMPQ